MIYRMEHSGRRYNRQQCIGEMVELPGVHIVRSTGRKDRHSKVHTSRGLRDRRVRLSAHTAIQFYDVQDRLGYDRPSKAVDWLIQNARDAIDQLEDNHAPADRCTAHDQTMQAVTTVHNSIMQPVSDAIKSSSFFPAPLSSNVINKPFSTATAAASYHNYTPDLLLHTSSRSQDLHLSLQSFHQPIIQDHSHQNPSYTLQSFCSAHGATAVTCPEINERMAWWNAPANSCDGGGEFLHNVVPPSQFQLCAQREPLHSSNLPSLRAWANSTASSPSWMFTSENYGGFSGFHIPAWIQGEEEHHGIANNQHSASSASHQ